MDDNQTICIADMGNNRVVTWKLNETSGQILLEDSDRNSLNCPTDIVLDTRSSSVVVADHDNRRVIRYSPGNSREEETFISNSSCYGLAIDRDGSIYISDREKNEVRRWRRGERDGIVVAGGNGGPGKRLNQLNSPTFIFVDDNYSVYISDCWNHRVMKWFKDAKEGIVVAGGNGDGDRLKQFSYPNGLFVDGLGRIYVADTGNHRIMCWREGAREGTIVVGKHNDDELVDQLRGPISLAFDRQGNLYVVDQWNHRIQKFEIDDNNNNET